VDKDSCLRDGAVACDQAYVTQRSTLSGHARAEDAAYIRGAVLCEEARASGSALVLDARDRGKFPKLSGHCTVYGTVAGYRNRRNPLGRKNPQQHTGYADTGWAKPLYCPEPGQG
jgi:hypothetical protein